MIYRFARALLGFTFLLASCDQSKAKRTPFVAPELGDQSDQLQNIWVKRLAQSNLSPCSIIYDFRRKDSFDFHVICLHNERSLIQVESYEYQTAVAGSDFRTTLVRSSCPNAKASFVFNLSLLPSTETRAMEVRMTSGSEFTFLQVLPEGGLVEDLRSAKTLHGRPIVRGCFSYDLKQFTASEVGQ